MPDLFDYLTWRGDLPLGQVPLSAVDGLILNTMSYIHFNGLIPESPEKAPTIRETADAFFTLPEEEQMSRVRSSQDRVLLTAMAESRRFGGLRLTHAVQRLDQELEMQFAAITVLLEGEGAFAAFRGTDNTLVGWKEDLNLGFLDTIPGQWAARDYLLQTASRFTGPLWAGGHSKGGNLAVFAAAACPEEIQSRIRAVYNNDGPGFSQHVLDSEGYRRILPQIQTFVPQSSVVGMLLGHEEPYTVVKSRQVGLLQHDPYSWEVLGPDFVRLEDVTGGSHIIDQTLTQWIAGMSTEEREAFVDAVYELFRVNDAESLSEIVLPRNVTAILQRFWKDDGESRKVMLNSLSQLWKTAAAVLRETSRAGKNLPDKT